MRGIGRCMMRWTPTSAKLQPGVFKLADWSEWFLEKVELQTKVSASRFCRLRLHSQDGSNNTLARGT